MGIQYKRTSLYGRTPDLPRVLRRTIEVRTHGNTEKTTPMPREGSIPHNRRYLNGLRRNNAHCIGFRISPTHVYCQRPGNPSQSLASCHRADYYTLIMSIDWRNIRVDRTSFTQCKGRGNNSISEGRDREKRKHSNNVNHKEFP